MEKIKVVLIFEYLNCIKNKFFKVNTIIIIAICVLFGLTPYIANIVKSTFFNKSSEISENIAKIAISAENNLYTKDVLNKFFSEYTWIEFSKNELEDVKVKIEDKEYDFAIIIDDLNITIIKANTSLANDLPIKKDELANMVKIVMQRDFLHSQNFFDESLDDILNMNPVVDIQIIGKDISFNFPIFIILCILLYLSLTLYGTFIGQSTVSEKSSKTIELLITSTKAKNVIYGKVFGIGLAGLTQVSVSIIAFFITYYLSKSAWENLFPVIVSSINYLIISGIFIYAVIVFILGFFSFAFLYCAFGSMASKQEDANSVMAFPIIVGLISFYIAIFSFSFVDSMFIFISSFLPFVSPLVMFLRISTSEVPIIQVILFVLLNITYILFIGYIGTKIYEFGVISYGKKVTFRNIIKILKR